MSANGDSHHNPIDGASRIGAHDDQQLSDQPPEYIDIGVESTLDEFDDPGMAMLRGRPESGLERDLEHDMLDPLDESGDLDLTNDWEAGDAPDEFSFGWSDLGYTVDKQAPKIERRPSQPAPKRRTEAPTGLRERSETSDGKHLPAARGKQPVREPSQALAIARLAADASSPAEASALIAAVVPLVLQARLGELPDPRIVSTSVVAAARLASYLHRHPEGRAHIVRFPAILTRLAEMIRQDEAQGHTVVPWLIPVWMESKVRQRLDRPTSRRRTKERQRHSSAATNRPERHLTGWWTDDSSGL